MLLCWSHKFHFDWSRHSSGNLTGGRVFLNYGKIQRLYVSLVSWKYVSEESILWHSYMFEILMQRVDLLLTLLHLMNSYRNILFCSYSIFLVANIYYIIHIHYMIKLQNEKYHSWQRLQQEIRGSATIAQQNNVNIM